jgi:hypothetical protein
VLAQLAGPAGQNFSAATGAEQMDPALVRGTGEQYAEVLQVRLSGHCHHLPFTIHQENSVTETAQRNGKWNGEW